LFHGFPSPHCGERRFQQARRGQALGRDRAIHSLANRAQSNDKGRRVIAVSLMIAPHPPNPAVRLIASSPRPLRRRDSSPLCAPSHLRYRFDSFHTVHRVSLTWKRSSADLETTFRPPGNDFRLIRQARRDARNDFRDSWQRLRDLGNVFRFSGNGCRLIWKRFPRTSKRSTVCWQRPSASLETLFFYPGNDFRVASKAHRIPGNASRVAGKPFRVAGRCSPIAGTYAHFERNYCRVDGTYTRFTLTIRRVAGTPRHAAIRRRRVAKMHGCFAK